MTSLTINLGTNAIKYNRPHGSVAFSYATRNGTVRISVDDTGIGIPQHRQSELFQPFNRLGAEEKAIEGTGVGLALTRRLVELMGGKVGFASVVGEGSSFWIDMPIYVASSQSEDHPIAPEAPQHSDFSVLYVDDNPASRLLMRDLLATMPNVKFIEAANGAMGLEMAKECRPDVIVLDINLPDINGVALLKQIKSLPEFATTPVLALSANAMPRDIRRGKEAGFFDYITKPLDVKQFLKTIDAALSSKQRNQAPGLAS